MHTVAFRTILVPTDFSTSAASAFKYALALAKSFSARLIIVHVMERSVYSMDFAMTHPDFGPEVKRRTAELLRAWVEHARAENIEAESALVAGIPFTEICNEAKRRGVDLLVMGTHGRTGLAHLMLGSTAERVVRLALCPVLTVKAESTTAPSVPVVGAENVERERTPRTAAGGEG